jgi:23S rRNA pseudouridine2605 synthase
MLERLQKIIARAGIASRRHAEQLILSGQVRVNGETVTELGTKADPEVDKIEAAGKAIQAEERHVYLVLHKPTEVVSSLADPEGRRTLRNLLRGFPQRVYPVGNLEYAAAGFVFLTNDGDLAARLLKGWDELEQVYQIKVKGMLTLADLERIGKETRTRMKTLRQPDAMRGHAANFWYEVRFRGARLEGLRTALFREQHPVEKVHRVGLGTLTIEGVPRGRYRVLEKREVEGLEKAKSFKGDSGQKSKRKN